MFDNKEFNFIDIGSIGGLPKPWDKYSDNIDFLLNFEPNDTAVVTEKTMTYNTAVWEKDETLPFYIYKGFNNTGSSLFKQNYTYVKNNWEMLKNRGSAKLADSWFDRSTLIETKKLKCRALDNILKEEFPNKKFHFLKIDAQGAEYNILKGAENFLSTSCIGLHLELFVIPLYENIMLLDEVVLYLKKFGFELVKKFPTHGTFNSQHDCLFIHKNRNKELANIIKKIYSDAEKLIIPKESNLDFSIKINNLYTYIENLKKSNYKLAIYGNGIIGNILATHLKDQVVAIFDKNQDLITKNKNILHPNEIKNQRFDKLIISVLGREKEIIESLPLPLDKIYTLDVTKKAKSIVFLEEDDNKSFCGPFTINSSISFDETQLLSSYFNKQKNGIMIDVGAHHGSAARPFLEKNWTVYGYEPDPNNRKVLIEKLKNYSSFILSPNAVSNKGGEKLDFFASEESTGISGLSSFTESHEKICEVTTTTLTNEISKHKLSKVDFLKIDTEGFDLMVLKGFPWDKIHPDVIECEFEDFKTIPLGYNFNDIADFLISKEYTVYVSEWYPIIKYGSQHTWKRLFKYSNQKIDEKSWGNLLAFKTPPEEEHLLTLLKDTANIEY